MILVTVVSVVYANIKVCCTNKEDVEYIALKHCLALRIHIFISHDTIYLQLTSF